jgi:hypothetical protein
MMAIRLEDKEKLFLAQLDEEGTARGNKRLRESLGWGERAYFEVRAELLQKGQIALGRGRGGSVKRAFGDDQVLLAAVPLEGFIPNRRIIEHLGWSHDRYWEVRSRLIDEGQLVVGKGKGGTISRAQDESEEEEEEEEPQENVHEDERINKKGLESHLYPKLAETLKSGWASLQKLERPIVENCARLRGNKGMWKNPDLLMVAQRPYELIGARYLVDIWTFEVKLPGWKISAISEADENGHGATHACALLQIDGKVSSERLVQCEETASRYKVGLITFVDPANISTWRVRVKPERRAEDFVKQRLFLERTMTQEGQEQMKAWSDAGSQSPQRYGKFTCSG